MAINITPGQAQQMSAHELHAKSHQPAVAAELGRRLAQVGEAMLGYDDVELGDTTSLIQILNRIEHILNCTTEQTK